MLDELIEKKESLRKSIEANIKDFYDDVGVCGLKIEVVNKYIKIGCGREVVVDTKVKLYIIA